MLFLLVDVSNSVINAILNQKMAHVLMRMMPLNELKEKIEKLQTERTKLNGEIKRLKLEADGKALQLQQEINGLREEADYLREMLATKSG